MRKYEQKKCPNCSHKKTTTIVFCDKCGKDISKSYEDYDSWRKSSYKRLRIIEEVPYESDDVEVKDFCGWDCLFEFLKTFSSGFYDYIEFPDIKKDQFKKFMEFIK